MRFLQIRLLCGVFLPTTLAKMGVNCLNMKFKNLFQIAVKCCNSEKLVYWKSNWITNSLLYHLIKTSDQFSWKLYQIFVNSVSFLLVQTVLNDHSLHCNCLTRQFHDFYEVKVITLSHHNRPWYFKQAKSINVKTNFTSTFHDTDFSQIPLHKLYNCTLH